MDELDIPEYRPNSLMAEYGAVMLRVGMRRSLNSRIGKIRRMIRRTEDVESKRDLIREIGSCYEDLHKLDYSLDAGQYKRLAENCYRASQIGWRK